MKIVITKQEVKGMLMDRVNQPFDLEIVQDGGATATGPEKLIDRRVLPTVVGIIQAKNGFGPFLGRSEIVDGFDKIGAIRSLRDAFRIVDPVTGADRSLIGLSEAKRFVEDIYNAS